MLAAPRWVSGAVLVALAVAMAGCGSTQASSLSASTSAESATLVAARPDDPYVKPDDARSPWPTSTEPLLLGPGQTVVTITFDDNWASAATAADMMTKHSLSGTFFVNSGTVGTPDHVSLADLRSMAAAGHEIAGHTLTHPAVENLDPDEALRQVCNDRDTLLEWGFPVRNFAYPFGSTTPDFTNAVRQCGYNSARSLATLRAHRVDPEHPLFCDDCGPVETVPPADPMDTRAPAEVDGNWTVADFKGQVTDAMAVGGWVQLTFHKLCTTDCASPENTLPNGASVAARQADFEQFLDWLAAEQAQGSVLVRTVGDVIGGPVAPPVAAPAVPPAPPGVNGVRNAGLEDQVDGVPVCWKQDTFGENTAEFSLVPGAHSGTTASRLVVRNYVNGDAKLVQKTDQGTCAPSVSPGRTYRIEAWYTSTAPTSFTVYYRLARGVWVYATSSPDFPPATAFTPARFTLWNIPNGVTAVSFGLALRQNGELSTDDYSLVTGAR